MAGFEPATNGLTVRCATAAPHPKERRLFYRNIGLFCLRFLQTSPTDYATHTETVYMAIKDSLIGNLLRIVTPDAMNELMASLYTGQRESLTAILEQEVALAGEAREQVNGRGELRTGKEVLRFLSIYLPMFSAHSLEGERIAEPVLKAARARVRLDRGFVTVSPKKTVSSYEDNIGSGVKKSEKEGNVLEKSVCNGLLVNKRQS